MKDKILKILYDHQIYMDDYIINKYGVSESDFYEVAKKIANCLGAASLSSETYKPQLSKNSERDKETGSCETCNHWNKIDHSYFDYNDGKCNEIKSNDHIQYEIVSGWEGGYLSEIITDHDFGCSLYKPRR